MMYICPLGFSQSLWNPFRPEYAFHMNNYRHITESVCVCMCGIREAGAARPFKQI